MDWTIKKKNRKIHNILCCYRFWYLLAEQFMNFDDLLKTNEQLTPEDNSALHEIHSLLFRCYELAKERRNKWTFVY